MAVERGQFTQWRLYGNKKNKDQLKLIRMQFRRKFGRKKESKPTKGLFLILLLVVAVILWYKMEVILDSLF